jgi:hypothetical protein
MPGTYEIAESVVLSEKNCVDDCLIDILVCTNVSRNIKSVIVLWKQVVFRSQKLVQENLAQPNLLETFRKIYLPAQTDPQAKHQ